MKLILCNPRGFCAGVIRAIETVEKALSIWGAPIYVKHEIVHNRHVVQRLSTMGAIFIEDLKQVPEGSRIIYSAHGVSPTIREEAKARNLIEIDATCGLVTKVHSAAKRFANKGYHILLIGHKNHVEIIGTKGEAPDSTTVIESVNDVNSLSFPPDQKLFYLTQTTLSIDDVKSIVSAIQEKYPHVETLPSSSICYATTNRQHALKSVSEKADLVLVVGDPTSSNSNRLCEIAKNAGKKAFLINEEEQIQKEWIEGVNTIALSAGASTPEEVVDRCIQKLQKYGVNEITEYVETEENVVFSLPKEVMVKDAFHPTR